jgi:hypothetical protein
MGCKHENADHLMPGDCTRPWGHITVEQFRCLDCGAWLSLGPANDTPEVCVEIRAAELVALGDEWWNGRKYVDESRGVLCFHNGGTPGDDDDGGCSEFADEEWAGYLARCIATHDTTREGSGE